MEINSSTTFAANFVEISANETSPPDAFSFNTKILLYLLVTVTSSFTGTIGNFLVIGAIIVHKKLRVLSIVFVGNLAVADLCVSAVTNPFTAVGIFHNSFYQNYPEVCETLAVICTVSCVCSVWSMSMISLNRYIAICHNRHYQKIYNKKTVPFIIASIWMYSFMLDLPNFVGWGRHVYDPKAYVCTPDHTESYGYNLCFMLLGLLIPMGIAGFCYIRIFCFARKSTRRLQSQLASPIQRNDMRLLKTVTITWVTFILMWTPFAATLLFDFSGNWPQWAWILVIALAHTNSSINSILYAATNQNFRDGYVIFIKRIWRGICIVSSCLHLKNSNNAQKISMIPSPVNSKEYYVKLQKNHLNGIIQWQP
ncbi:melatonin receptor type 1B-like [Amphiura filiformis]|uniref:melatonin receptor type 1B-like n=1 Tax=Amphiura filiformis TaxID=82378 RepID=UPI003B224388